MCGFGGLAILSRFAAPQLADTLGTTSLRWWNDTEDTGLVVSRQMTSSVDGETKNPLGSLSSTTMTSYAIVVICISWHAQDTAFRNE